MMNSISERKKSDGIKSEHKEKRIRLWAVAFWLVVWQAASMALNQEILLASPIASAVRLSELAITLDFWRSIGYSAVRIAGGFALSVLAGGALAAVSAGSVRIRELAEPLVSAVKATPVASFIIIVLIWIPSKNLAFVISFLMVFPVIYANVLQGIMNTDRELLEMAEVFRVPAGRRIRYIYAPSVMPFFRSACSLGLGLCWKSGIAAEVIGQPDGSMGERLYSAKIYLETPDLFAWTATIIAVSVIFEKLFMAALDALMNKLNEKRLPELSDPEGYCHDCGNKRQKRVKRNSLSVQNAAAAGRTADVTAGNIKIELENVTRMFGNDTPLKNINAELDLSSPVCIMAPSGSGKTTLLRILAGLDRGYSGSIKGLEGLRAAVVFQENRLLENISAVQNIRFAAGKAASAGEGEELLEELGIRRKEAYEKPVSEFSGGMKRRTALARALCAEYDILLLDEPFTGLDDETRRRCTDAVLRRTEGGRGVILVTHDPRDAEAIGAKMFNL